MAQASSKCSIIQSKTISRLKLIAGPDVKGTYVFEDQRGEYRLFLASTTDPVSSIEEILQNGEWVGEWRSTQW